jgi:uncharacterized protein (TIGR03118 family)
MGHSLRARAVPLAAALAAAALAAGVAAAASAHHEDGAFAVHALVSDQPGMADHTDGHLVNAWGLAASATSPWWVADNEPGLATVYDATGAGFPAASPLVVGVPDNPTGVVASSDTAFSVGTGATAAPSRFIFATETGKILGWHGGLSQAILGSDQSPSGAVFKGLAIANDHLYATDFHNGRVDVFDSGFTLVNTPGAFVDPRMPRGFAPFGIQTLGGEIFVTYARQGPGTDELHGRGLGFVDAYDTSGTFLGRVASRGDLNAPWGLALAPAGFGSLAGDLLVGNFGDGRINVFAPARAHTEHGTPVHGLRDHGGGGDEQGDQATRARRACSSSLAASSAAPTGSGSRSTASGRWSSGWAPRTTARRRRSSSPPARTTSPTGSSGRSWPPDRPRPDGDRVGSIVRPASGSPEARPEPQRRLRRMIRSATSPVHPVWCEAPMPAPVSPWKYSWNGISPCQAGSSWKRW